MSAGLSTCSQRGRTLRRNEIRQLTWGDARVDSLPAKITLRAQTTKSKRADAWYNKAVRFIETDTTAVP